MGNILSNIEELARKEGITITSLERSIGASKGVLSRAIAKGTDIQAKWIQAIVENYPQYSAKWLLTGEGCINSSEDEQVHIYKGKSSEPIDHEGNITLYDVQASANLKTLFDNKDQNILGKITIPDIPKCDGAVYVKGESMSPILKSGDIIAYKIITPDTQHIIFGEMYLVSIDMDGDEYLAVKYVEHSDKGEDWIQLVSHNPHYQPKDFPLSSVRALALVKLSIRMNTMK